MMLDIGPSSGIGESRERPNIDRLTLIISIQDGWVGEALLFLEPDFAAEDFFEDMLRAIIKVLRVFFSLPVLIAMLGRYWNNWRDKRVEDGSGMREGCVETPRAR
jgi:hypothetical protein